MLQNRYLFASTLLIAACGRPALSPSDVALSPAEIWLHPHVRFPNGNWSPNEAVVAEMKVAVDKALKSRVPTADAAHMAGQYWFEYEGRWSGNTKTIFFVGRLGRPFVAMDVVSGAIIPEICHVFGTYIPSTKKVTNVSVGGFNCPARI